LNNSPGLLSLDYYGCSDIGMVRIENQDSLGKYPPDNFDLYTERGHLFIVADGMGGHAGGRLASSTAVDIITDVFRRSYSTDMEQLISKALSSANQAIYQKAQDSIDYKKMGTTCVVLVLNNDKASIGNVGDSRIYKIESGNIEQLTTDHTQVQEMMKRGILTPEEAEKHPSRSILARALGVDPEVESDVLGGIELKPGQIFILCTDGLSKVTSEEILRISTENNPKDACDKLIGLANERGGKDNVTVQIIKISSTIPAIEKTVPKKKSHFTFFLFLIILAAALFLFSKEISDLIKGENNEIIQQENVPVPEVLTVQQDDKFAAKVQQAEALMKKGRLEGALDIYKSILTDEPMHLTALNGTNEIIAIYLSKADALKGQNNFKGALSYYVKINELQPGNKKISDNIILCENQMKYSGNSDSSFSKQGLKTEDLH
jgi:serine/threonine protein phosphatase PrpC